MTHKSRKHKQAFSLKLFSAQVNVFLDPVLYQWLGIFLNSVLLKWMDDY